MSGGANCLGASGAHCIKFHFYFYLSSCLTEIPSGTAFTLNPPLKFFYFKSWPSLKQTFSKFIKKGFSRAEKTVLLIKRGLIGLIFFLIGTRFEDPIAQK